MAGKNKNGILKRIGTGTLFFALTYLFIISGLFVFLQSNYQVAFTDVTSIAFKASFEPYNLVLYTQGEHASEIDFNQVYTLVPDKKPDFVYELPKKKIRSFRIYLSQERVGQTMEAICLHSIRDSLLLNGNEFTFHSIVNSNEGNKIFVLKGIANSYLELKRQLLTFTEWCLALGVILTVGLVVAYALCFLLNCCVLPMFISMNTATKLACAYILAMFLPHPLFNIAFLVALAFSIKNFRIKRLNTSTVSWLFIVYFLYFLANNFFRNQTFTLFTLETQLPVLFLPLLFASAPRYNYLKFVPLSVLIYGLYCFAAASINFTVYKNLNYFSFQLFTGHYHAVYYSYAVAFSLIFLELTRYKDVNRSMFRPALLLLLLLSGSKLIICFMLLFYLLVRFKNKMKLAVLTLLLGVGVLMLFKPIRQRFNEILNLKAISILNEAPLKSGTDPRINGLTLRLILWQETLRSISGSQKLLFGQGSGIAADKHLQQQLTQRNLERAHTAYDPHNQFITILYKLGLVGLLILLGIVGYCFYFAIKNHNHVLLYITLLFCTAMMAESVLQRVSGIYFFVTVLILLCVSDTGNNNDLPDESLELEL